MDWLHFVALSYFILTAPFVVLGLLALFMLGSAFVSARGDRRDRDDEYP